MYNVQNSREGYGMQFEQIMENVRKTGRKYGAKELMDAKSCSRFASYKNSLAALFLFLSRYPT